MKGSLRSKIVGDQIENLTERNELLCLNFWKIRIVQTSKKLGPIVMPGVLS
jgi:hypothetical protein